MMITRRSFIGFISAAPLVVTSFAPSLGYALRWVSIRYSWSEFTDLLADALAALEQDEYLIVSKKDSWYYVQFAADDDFTLRAEAVSNGYLDGEHRLSLPACAKLLGFGWNRPTYLPADADGPAKHPWGSPNYFLDFRAPVPYGSVATLASHTLRHVFGAEDPGTLAYKAFSPDGSSIRFPHLRLARRR